MRVIALASQKGGTGKTTLAGHLAVQAHRAGAGPVVLIETDSMGTLADWWDARAESDIAFVESHMGRVAADLALLREDGFRLALIDTPTGNAIAMQTILQQTDLVVIPVCAGPHDLKSIGAMLDICDRVGKPAVFVINSVRDDTPMAEQVAAALAQHGHVMPQWIGHEAAIAPAMAQGQTVMDMLPTCDVSLAFADLWDLVCQRADSNFRRTVFAAPTAPVFAAASRLTPMGFGRRSNG